MVKTTNDLAAFKKDVLPSLVEFIDDVMTDAEWIKVREHQKTVQKLNYRVDRQGVRFSSPGPTMSAANDTYLKAPDQEPPSITPRNPDPSRRKRLLSQWPNTLEGSRWR